MTFRSSKDFRRFRRIAALGAILFSTFVHAGDVTPIDGKENLPPSISHFLYDEQALHNKKLWPKDSFYSDIDQKYLPESRNKFKLPYFIVPPDLVEFLVSKELNPEVKSQLMTEKGYRLFVHPESQSHYQFLEGEVEFVSPEKSEFWAAPTGSYRSLVVWKELENSTPFIAKVSLDLEVLKGIDRLVSENEVKRSIANQQALESIPKDELDRGHTRYFPETAGLSFKFETTRNLKRVPKKIGGQIIREFPKEVLDGKVRWISFSAVMSPETNSPFMKEIIKRPGWTAERFTKDILIEDYLKMTEVLNLKYGLSLEPHSQNLMMEVDSQGIPTRHMVIRDFGGIWPDGLRVATTGDLYKAYAHSPSDQTYKFMGGRTNIIGAHTFFFRRQVFDFIVRQFDIRDEKLRNELDLKFKKLVERYEPGVEIPAHISDSNKKTIIEKIKTSSRLPNPDQWASIESTPRLHDFLRLKKEAGQFIALNPSPPPNASNLYFFINKNAIALLDGPKPKTAHVKSIYFLDRQESFQLAGEQNGIQNSRALPSDITEAWIANRRRLESNRCSSFLKRTFGSIRRVFQWN